MGGLTKPSTSMVKTPPPKALNPGLNQQFQGMLQTQGPQYGQTLGEAMRTGMPSDVGPQFQAMLQARQRSSQQGMNNILEQYGASGNRYGSGIQNALVDYQLQDNMNFNTQLGDYSMRSHENAAMRMMQALGLFGGQYEETANTLYAGSTLVSGPSALSQLSGAAQSAATVGLALKY